MSEQMEMPRYRCHKEVCALKIESIEIPFGKGGVGIIIPSDKRYLPIDVDYMYMNKHKPEVGGYYVVYDDGYKSFSPAKAFEEGYSKI